MLSHKTRANPIRLLKSTRFSDDVTHRFVFDFLSGLDCPRALTVWLLFSSGEHDQLVKLDCDPHSYPSGLAFRDAYAATKLLSKADFLKTTFDRKQVAMTSFRAAEEQCRAVNRRFRSPLSDPQYVGPNVWLLNATKRKIEEVLGVGESHDSFDAEKFIDSCDWGPGVTTRLTGSHVSATNKFLSESGITRDCFPFAAEIFPAAYPLWWRHLRRVNGSNGFTFEVGSKVITVPKNAKTERTIAVEPGINLWFQKGMGKLIRSRLRRFGIDLDDQTRNQELARRSSLDGRLATVDFSAASDTISKEVVRALLPERWFVLLNLFRSRVGLIAGEPLVWEKFSSMGNGFTFELESLIFFAAALAVKEYENAPGAVSVFGDDVILPSSCYPLFSSFCDFLGFKVNLSKSFSEGPFRESCGSHYYDGLDVKPYFLTERIRDAQQLYRVANGIRLLGHRRNLNYGCDRCLLPAWLGLLQRLPKPLRLRSPAIKSTDLIALDGSLSSNFDEAVPQKARNGFEGYYVHSFTHQPIEVWDESDGLLLARLRGSPDRAYGNNYMLRGRTSVRLTRVLVKDWYDLGPWC